MKQQVNPLVAAGIAAIVLIVAGIFIWRGTSSGSGSSTAANDKPVVPADVTAEFNKRMGGMQGAGGAPSVPGGGGGAPAQPPAGGGSGYMAPPPGR